MQESCNMQPCPADWIAGEWSAVSWLLHCERRTEISNSSNKVRSTRVDVKTSMLSCPAECGTRFCCSVRRAAVKEPKFVTSPARLSLYNAIRLNDRRPKRGVSVTLVKVSRREYARSTTEYFCDLTGPTMPYACLLADKYIALYDEEPSSSAMFYKESNFHVQAEKFVSKQQTVSSYPT